MSDLYTMKRGWMEHPLFVGEEYSRAQAWEWMVSQAAWKETRTRVDGKIIPLQRGQLSFSVRFLAEKWGWSKSRVDRFIGALQQQGMIETCSKIGTSSGTIIETRQQVITICNYSEYQFTPKSLGTTIGTSCGTRAGQERDKEEEGNKEIINITPYNPPPPPSGRFEEFWKKFPNQRKGNKEKSERAYRRALARDAEENIHAGLDAYLGSDEVAKGYAKGVEAWLNDDRWRYQYQSRPASATSSPTGYKTQHSNPKRKVLTCDTPYTT